jgi:iron complex outermembrane recepter protein
MKKLELLGATALALLIANPAYAQTAKPVAGDAAAKDDSGDIVVTAQRTSETIQSVPIAISAFSAKTLEAQQIDNASDLQLTLPNVVFSKGNFTGSSFTIRGVGDLCVGNSCDSATAIHVNDSPLLATRLFETEYFDLERVEVLRGPQGTLYGRNATSGVVNFITAKPDLSGFHAAADGEYSNFNSYKIKGMINAPIGDTLGVRLAAYYLKRDGYTTNVFNNTKLDGRDEYAVRGSLRWEPSSTTRLDLMGYYFREKDNRLRIQKQLCQRDTTGILGCLAGRLDFGTTNANSTFVGTLTSKEFLSGRTGSPLFAGMALGSLYGPDAYATNVNPADVRAVSTDHAPTYFTDETQLQAHLKQDFGALELNVSGLYTKSSVDSQQDYNLSVQNAALYAGGLATLGAAAGGTFGPGVAAYLGPVKAAINPSAGVYCTSLAEPTGTGAFGGHKVCASTPEDFDRSNGSTRTWSVEGVLNSKFDGPLNFLLGGIYVDAKTTDGSYYVNSFGIDYVTGVLGSATGLGSGGALPPGYLGTPFFRNYAALTTLKSYGLFGEGYYNISDKFKLTVGVRYNHDQKGSTARSTLASFYTPFTATDATLSPFAAGFDADPKTVCSKNNADGSANTTAAGALGSAAGCEAFQVRDVTFTAVTGRVVLDYKIAPNHLLYASFSRGYKSGGINPPLQPIFAVPDSFGPEHINSFEIGSKNTFAGGKFQFNLTAFYYQYKQLQLSRIVARTSVNDNVDANIYGLEADAVFRPSRNWQVNMGASYLHTEVATDKFLSNPRDPSGGRSDAVIIKDITNGSNCAVIPTTAGNAAGSNGFVNQVNTIINSGAIPGFPGNAGLQPTTAFAADGGIAGRGAFSICAALNAIGAGPLGTAFGGVKTLFEGVSVNIKGNKLPQAPNYKFSAGVQYTAHLDNGMSIVPRADLTYTGETYGNIFNGNINRLQGYSQINAQIQLNGADDKWFVRGFIQNVTDNNATTGLYVTDQSSGLFTNIFTLEPRRYGISAGIKF